MSAQNDQIFLPLEKRKRGRQSEICENDFLNLIAKHAEIFKSYGKMLPVNHQIITEFAIALGATCKGMHLKIKRYFEVSKFFGVTKTHQVDNDESEEEINGTVRKVDAEYVYMEEDHQTLLLSSDQTKQLMPVISKTKRPQMPDNWSFYIAELIWESGTKTECAYRFLNGNIVGGELKTKATCSECGAEFNIYSEENFKSIHIIWINKGNPKILHNKKRKFSKNVNIENSKAIINASSTTYMRRKAADKMTFGEVTPATIAKPGNIQSSVFILMLLQISIVSFRDIP